MRSTRSNGFQHRTVETSVKHLTHTNVGSCCLLATKLVSDRSSSSQASPSKNKLVSTRPHNLTSIISPAGVRTKSPIAMCTPSIDIPAAVDAPRSSLQVAAPTSEGRYSYVLNSLIWCARERFNTYSSKWFRFLMMSP